MSCVHLRNLLHRSLTLMSSYRPTLLICSSNQYCTRSIDPPNNSAAGIYCRYHFSGPKTDNQPTEGSQTCNLPTQGQRSEDSSTQSYEHLCCNHTSVLAFKSHWLDVLTEYGIPEPDWSVKWITEHVQKINCSHSKVCVWVDNYIGSCGIYNTTSHNYRLCCLLGWSVVTETVKSGKFYDVQADTEVSSAWITTMICLCFCNNYYHSLVL